MLTALVAFQRYTKSHGRLAVGLAVGLIGEYAYNAVSVKNEMQADTSDNEFAKALADAVSVQPGFGLILGVLSLARWPPTRSGTYPARGWWPRPSSRSPDLWAPLREGCARPHGPGAPFETSDRAVARVVRPTYAREKKAR